MECMTQMNQDEQYEAATPPQLRKHQNRLNTTSTLNLTKNGGKQQHDDVDTSVHVALRIRPQLSREKLEMCKVCTYVTPNEPQVTLGADKSFTFDYVFDINSKQHDVFTDSVKGLVDCTLDGYNATVLAYGQTGSGKTYSMGTSFDINLLPEEEGIIPRAVQYLFQQVDERCKSASSSHNYSKIQFQIYAQFMELYNEEIIDLFDTNLSRDLPLVAASSSSSQPNSSFISDSPIITTINPSRLNRQKIEIHEDMFNNVYVSGCTMRTVMSAGETLELLKTGARSRTTAATNMNLQSSRSHAIFTLHVKQQRYAYKQAGNEMVTSDETNDIETLTAKFHFVDLAGSERLKRTGAIGDRAKEGICINRGLLALGNVISALGDDDKRGSHVPYRDSKLTRLLQDSLGGNSRTLMIACVSSSDSDFMETLNTLRYANRARNIKNKIVVNQDKTSKQVALLRAEIQQLQLELMEYKAGKKISITDGNCVDNILLDNGTTINVNELKQENFLIKSENNSLRIRCKAMQDTIDNIRDKNSKLLTECELYKINDPNLNVDIDSNSVIHGYMEQIEDLRCKLVEAECTCQHLRKSIQLFNSKSSFNTVIKQNATSITDDDDAIDMSRQSAIELLLEEAKKDLAEQKVKKSLKATASIPIKKSRSPDFSLNSDHIRLMSASGIELRSPLMMSSTTQLTSNSTTPTNSFSNVLTSSTQTLSVSAFNIDESCILDDEQEQEQNGQLQENLTNLDVEIDMKQRLINELEIQKKNYEKMKYHYEEKLHLLHDRIGKIEDERDKVLSNIAKINQDNKYDDQIKKVKLDYEQKLKTLQYEVQKYSTLRQKHTQMLKIQNANEKQMQQLSTELIEMKKMKVKLMHQLKEETQKYRAHELKRKREIEVLRRDQLKKENQIKTLNEDNKRKSVILKRKQEQIQALSKRNSAVLKMSDKAAGRMTSSLILTNSTSSSYSNGNGNQSISPKTVQNKWRNIENNIQSIITKKQTICLIERDMERYLEQREKLGRKLNRFAKRLEKLFSQEYPDRNKTDELKEQIEIMRSNIDYIQDQISECQANIIELDEAKDKTDFIRSQKLIASINSVDEAKYLVDKFFTMALNKGVLAAQKEYLNKELELELGQFEREHYSQQQLLQQLLNGESDFGNGNGNDFELDEIILAPQIQDSSDSESSSRSDSPVRPLQMTKLLSGTQIIRKNDEEPSVPAASINDQIESQKSPTQQEKARTQAAKAPEDYLYCMPQQKHQKMYQSTEQLSQRSRLLSQSYTKLAPNSKHAPVIIDTDDTYYSSILQLTGDDPLMDESRSRTKSLSMSRYDSKESLLSTSPNGSPHTNNKRISQVRDENVFNRLTSETKQTPLPEAGSIKPYTGSTTRFRSSPLTCSHIAEGHSKAVLSVDSFDYKLFSSSKDRTAKIWDLHTGQEILSLIGHPNNVLKIRYSPELNLIFTVSSSYVKVWDMRETPSKCVKTLSSSGLVIDGDLGIYRSTRTLQNEIPIGEHQINDILLDKCGSKLYTAAGNAVKIWDLRQFVPIGKLPAGQNSTIMTLALDDDDFDNHTIVTGSKDHYIKIFDVVNNGVGVIAPKRSLVPPHYDGIQSLAIVNDLLFSGSRDMCIKKWDMVDYQCKQSINNAHKDWITVIDYLNDANCLMTACRAGYLKFWNIDTFEKLSEYRAHLLQINSIKINNNFVFTASDDATVKIWKKNY